MRNAYYEAARTYWRRPRTSLIETVLVGWFILLWLMSVALPQGVARGEFMPASLALAAMGVMIWTHFREQVTSEARRLAPGFVAPQVVILCLLIGLIVFFGPLLILLHSGTSPLGVMAFSAVCIAAVGWWMWRRSSLFFFICFALWFWQITEPGQHALRPLFQGKNEPLSMAILTVSLYAIVTTIRGMLSLTEEDPLYYRRLNLSGLNLRPRTTGEINHHWKQVEQDELFWRPPSRSIDAPTGTNLWSRSRRWRMLTRSSAWGIILMSFVLVLSMRIGSMGNAPLPVFLMFLIWMPAGMSTMAWQQIWRFLEADSLRPIARRDLLREIGFTILHDTLRGWACLAAVIAIDSLLLRAEPVPAIKVVTWTWLTLLLQIPAAGVALWLMRYRSPLKLMLGTMFAMVIPFILTTAISMEGALSSAYRMPVGFIVLGLAIAGCFILRDAYRRWLVTELG